MSQSGSFGSGGGTGGAVITLTGNTGGPITAFAGNINIIGQDPLTVSGDLGTHTLTIIDTSAVEASVATTDATPTTLYSFPVAINQAVTLNATIVAAEVNYANALNATIVCGAYRAVGAPIATAPKISINSDFAGVVALNGVISGNDLLIQVTGVAATTINWAAVIKIVTV